MCVLIQVLHLATKIIFVQKGLAVAVQQFKQVQKQLSTDQTFDESFSVIFE